MSDVMTPQAHWDYRLTHQGRAKVLAAIGRAQGYQFEPWKDLPFELRCTLINLWHNPSEIRQ